MVLSLSAAQETLHLLGVPRLVVKPTVCWDILEMVGKSVEAIREVEARAIHKHIFAPTFEFLEEDGGNYNIYPEDQYISFWDYLNYNYNTSLNDFGEIIGEDEDEYESAMEEMERDRQSQIVQGICQVRKWRRS
jgi:hypothetical protein